MVLGFFQWRSELTSILLTRVSSDNQHESKWVMCLKGDSGPVVMLPSLKGQYYICSTTKLSFFAEILSMFMKILQV